MRQFIDALEFLAEPARVATVRGRRTNYMFLIDADVTRVLASVAIDAPEYAESILQGANLARLIGTIGGRSGSRSRPVKG
jgi:hypothetical protein